MLEQSVKAGGIMLRDLGHTPGARLVELGSEGQLWIDMTGAPYHSAPHTTRGLNTRYQGQTACGGVHRSCWRVPEVTVLRQF